MEVSGKLVPRSDEDLTNHVASPNSAGDPLGHTHGEAAGGFVAERELCELTFGDESLSRSGKRET